MSKKGLKFLDFFAGIGGFRFGLEQANPTNQCVGYVEWDKFARRSYEAIHHTDGEWTAWDISDVRPEELPQADIWCFGSPCTNISLAGNRKGIHDGEQSKLFFEIIRLLRGQKEENKPSYLFFENVKNLISINGGRDFLTVLNEFSEVGYDAEWSVLDSAEVTAQHRERLFIVGHLRGRRTRQVFPIGFKDAGVIKKPEKIRVIGNIVDTDSFGGDPQRGRIYDVGAKSPTLNTMQGGGREPKIVVSVGDKSNSPIERDSHILIDDQGRRNKELTLKDKAPTLRAQSHGNEPKVFVNIDNNFYLNQLTDDEIIKHFRIRKLTPLECWRLQGFPDEAFYKAQAVNSNTQLYKEAGNSVTVPVIKAIADNFEILDD